ncbi:MAG: hypothetical protein P9F19_04610 [Candidatus Contendobacter sp.]|nr:hypothetical protein [Candidatus Contendobacter sp.]MDG4556661.1 hypothetical protein [Candidatus Contendobacter sp.]
MREQRQHVAQQPWNEQQLAALWYADEFLLELLTDEAESALPAELLRDDPTRPLAQWWWHLGKLRAGTYPAELLPSHLRAIYRPAQRTAA